MAQVSASGNLGSFVFNAAGDPVVFSNVNCGSGENRALKITLTWSNRTTLASASIGALAGELVGSPTAVGDFYMQDIVFVGPPSGNQNVTVVPNPNEIGNAAGNGAYLSAEDVDQDDPYVASTPTTGSDGDGSTATAITVTCPDDSLVVPTHFIRSEDPSFTMTPSGFTTGTDTGAGILIGSAAGSSPSVATSATANDTGASTWACTGLAFLNVGETEPPVGNTITQPGPSDASGASSGSLTSDVPGLKRITITAGAVTVVTSALAETP